MISEQMKRCPKCGDVSGDDWSQCGGSCPMPGSPHYASPKEPPMTIDPVELERLSKAATGVSETVDGGRWSCTIHFGEGEDARVNMRAFADFVLTSRRTSQLVPAQPSVTRKFSLGDRVTKTKGSSWTGLVVGFYSTSLTPIGYAVESENEPGSVQIYPESALGAHGGKQ